MGMSLRGLSEIPLETYVRRLSHCLDSQYTLTSPPSTFARRPWSMSSSPEEESTIITTPVHQMMTNSKLSIIQICLSLYLARSLFSPISYTTTTQNWSMVSIFCPLHLPRADIGMTAIGFRFPTLYSLIKSNDSPLDPLQASALARLLANPFTVAPLAFSLMLLLTSVLLEPEFHRSADLLMAAVETVFTFAIAYPAASSLGKVLLQTAPIRGLPNRQMETFDRALREVKRHPVVLHVPAPHVWQLTPPPSDPTERGPLVATVEIHVKKDTGDDEVLDLTRWAWELCTEALGGEVTISILRE